MSTPVTLVLRISLVARTDLTKEISSNGHAGVAWMESNWWLEISASVC